MTYIFYRCTVHLHAKVNFPGQGYRKLFSIIDRQTDTQKDVTETIKKLRASTENHLENSFIKIVCLFA